MKDEHCSLFSLNLSSFSYFFFSLLISLHPSFILLQVGFLIAATDIKYSRLAVFMGPSRPPVDFKHKEKWSLLTVPGLNSR